MPGCRQVFPVPGGLTQNSLEMWSLVLCLRGAFRKNSEGGFQLSTHITGSQQQTLLSLHGLGFPGVRASCSCGFSSRTDGSSDSPCTRCRLSPAHPWVLLGGCPFHFPELHGGCGSGLVPHGGPPAHSGPALTTLPSTAGPGRCWVVGSCLWGLPAMLGCGRRPTVCRAPFLPSSILQMDYCRGSHRRVIPDTVIIRAKGTLPPRRSRVNGWSKRLHPFQVVAWTMFPIVVLVTFCVFIPMLHRERQYITYAVSF